MEEVNNLSLDNLKKVEGGYLISEDGVIDLANYIKNLKEERDKFKSKYKKTLNSLKEERKQYEIVIEDKNKTIDLYAEQVENYKKLNSDYETQVENYKSQLSNYEELLTIERREQMINKLMNGVEVVSLLAIIVVMNN